MSFPSDFDEIGDTAILSPALYAAQDPKHAEEDERALRTNKISKEVFSALAPYMASSATLADQVTPPPEDAREVHSAAASTGLVSGFPNLSWEILRAGLLKENFMIKDLNEISKGIEEIQEKLGKVLKFNQKLTKLPSEKETYEITDDMKEDIKVLKEMGIDVLSPDEKTISAEKLGMIKTDLDHIKSQLQTNMQTKFMNVQTKTSQYSSLLDSLKTVEKHFSRLLSKILDNMTKR
ncbi:MAG: hypothetical protein JSS32_10530 [Verrucomicrobia bacterium]|nr:hypothetical protein [Verrucomicrobiota bacterium]